MLARFFLWGSFWLWGLGSLAAAPAALSGAASVSLLTCAPGTETYSLFGHSALRVTDPLRGLDRVYNYGTFDFQTPNFYGRFLRGDLQYFLSAASFPEFRAAYQRENRALSGQVLALQPAEVQRLYNRLETTLHSSARFYRYQFFADNCTTRLFELVSTSVEAPLHLDSAYAAPGRTYRQRLVPYLAPAPWVMLGMNLGLGLPADRPTTFRQGLFLPTELQRAFAHASRHHRPFVLHNEVLFAGHPTPPAATAPTPWTPAFCLTGLAIIMALAYGLPARYRFVARVLRGGLFIAAGLTGSLLLGLQLFSLHTPAHGNYQLLWLLPTHLGLAFARPTPGWRRYAAVALAFSAVGGLLGWWFYYAQLLPVAGLLLAVVLLQLLLFIRQARRYAS